jgi:valyl-tRNA synthetase
MPHLSEEAWQLLRTRMAEGDLDWPGGKEFPETIMLAPWPAVEPEYRDLEAEETFALLQDIIRAVRNIRSKLGVAERKPLEVVTSVPDERAAERLRRHERILKQLGYLERIQIGVGLEKPAGSATDVVGQIQVFVPLKGVLDIEEERDRLQKKIEQKENYVAGLLRKLSEPNFLQRAPAEVVAREKARCKELEEEVAKLRASLEELGNE